MNSIILSNSNLNIINLKIAKCKNQDEFKNFFFGPTISLRLYNPIISWADTKSISVSFKKSSIIKDCKIITNDNYNLLNLLRNVNEKLINVYKNYKEDYGHDTLDLIPTLFYEKDDYFYIKCNLPKKYSPKIGTIYEYILVDIRNIYEIGKKCGFRLDLKHYKEKDTDF